MEAAVCHVVDPLAQTVLLANVHYNSHWTGSRPLTPATLLTLSGIPLGEPVVDLCCREPAALVLQD